MFRQFLTTYPLLCNAFSLVILTLQNLRLDLPRHAHLNQGKRRGGEASGHGQSAPQQDSSWRRHTLAETILLVSGLVSILSSRDPMTAVSLSVPVLIDVLSWSYLVVLMTTALLIDTRSFRLYWHVWTHSTLLYGLHWLITTILYCEAAVEDGMPVRTSPLSYRLTVTSLLLGKRLCESVITVAKRPSKDGQGLVEIRASLLEFATFSWLDPLIWKGFCGRLRMRDVWALLNSETCASIAGKYQGSRKRSSIVQLLVYDLWYDLAIQSFWAVVASLTSYGPTLAMRSILNHVETISVRSSDQRVWLELYAMLAFGVFNVIADGQTMWQVENLKLKIRNILNSEIYRTIMVRTAWASGSPRVDDGAIMNLISSDSSKIADAGASAYEIFTRIPIRVITALVLLIRLLGLSSLVGVMMMLAITPLNSLIFKYMGISATKAMSATDMRVQETDRLLLNIRMIKFFSWEKLFQGKVGNKRSQELGAFESRLTWWSIMATVWYVVPSFITFAAFFTYTAVQQQPLPPSTAFTALSLFSLLKTPLDQLVGMSVKIQESSLSLQRVEDFLQEGGLTKYHNSKLEHTKNADRPAGCGLRDATLIWDSLQTDKDSAMPPSSFRLQNIDLSFIPKSLNILAGSTGSGKTSLLLGLLGEMKLLKGTLLCPEGHLSYCAQEAWLINDTIKRNIVFGATWDSKRYQATLHACALIPDLETLENKDDSMVGERGSALSGGQKQRVGLARAVYADSSYILLDDCLSAVDSKTAKWLVEKCIAGPLMEGRTCIIATHNIGLLLPYAASVAVLSNGTVIASGSPGQLRESKALLSLMKSQGTAASDQNGGSPNLEDIESPSTKLPDRQTKSEPDTNNDGTAAPELKAAVSKAGEEADETTHRHMERTPKHSPVGVVWSYLSAMGGPSYWVLITVLFTAQQLSAFASNWSLQNFANAYSRHRLSDENGEVTGLAGSASQTSSQSNTMQSNTWYHLSIYAIILVLYTVVNFARLHVASMGSLCASNALHKRLLSAILRAKFQFFDRTNHGTLTKLFTQDIQTLDHNVMPMASGTVHFAVMSISTIVLIRWMIPSFLLPGVLMMAVYLIIARFFLDSSRELEKIRSQTQETLYQHVSESLRGIVTIRAFSQEHSFIKDHYEKLDSNNRPVLYMGLVDSWLTFRLNVVGILMSFAAGYFAPMSVGKISPGAIGLTLTYTMTFSDNIMWLVRYYALNQQNLSAVERIMDASRVEPEAPEEIPSQPPDGWPMTGAMQFEKYSTKYHEGLPEVLKGLTFRVSAGDRIGVVGRTGAGKTSLSLAILRALEATEGSITIDGIDISTIGLHDLRRAVCLVPQDPSLFAGNLRENLDPYSEFSDDQIRQSLVNVGLVSAGGKPSSTLTQDGARDRDTDVDADPDRGSSSSTHSNSNNKKNNNNNRTHDDNNNNDNNNDNNNTPFTNLDMPIHSSGTNISLGQRQLLCLARALLRKPKLIILDEATSSIDMATSSKIQECLFNLSNQSNLPTPTTVITIAHRLPTILDHDRVLVMQKGQIVEIGPPWELLRQRDGMFRELCKNYYYTSGDGHGSGSSGIEELERIARRAWDEKRNQKQKQNQNQNRN